ncbi:MAG: ATP-dependent helicase [Nitrospiraceae bacterium]|nr:ATP-dependent helicase [Nitrospiraceae bacterium]
MEDTNNNRKFDEILNSTAKQICVIAGPGSGKTTGILIPKAKQIIADSSIAQKNVLLLTFSRLSAIDLQNKVKSIEKVPKASTLHSFCLSFLLTEDNHEIRKRVNSIIMDFEKKVMISDLKLILKNDKKKLRAMLDEFSAGWAIKPHDEVFNEDDEKRQFKAAILNWLSEHEAAMMEEIAYHAVDLATKIDSEFIAEPQYIFVDEFQDLNELEQRFIEILAKSSQLLIVVGDPDQSIYSFKFAYPVGITKFADKENTENHTLPFSGRCSTKILDLANKLLIQFDPTRKKLKTLPNAITGEVQLIQKQYQDEEFEEILTLIDTRLNSDASPKDIFILVPRKKLGIDFVKFATAKKENHHMLVDIVFRFAVKGAFTDREAESVSLLGIIANPEGLLHIRSYLGVGDENHFANEIKVIKKKYGSLKNAIQSVNPNDFDKKSKRVRHVCEKIIRLKEIIALYKNEVPIEKVINDLFPDSVEELLDIRQVLFSLKEVDDTIKSLYSKFIDYTRTIHFDNNVIKVMTLMASKGLEADHVFILGCNDGNIPGKNRSAHLTDHEHKQEQRRLLYVGITRAKKTLAISWSRDLPFRQSKGHHTASIGTVKRDGKTYSRVGLSEFLQDISL